MCFLIEKQECFMPTVRDIAKRANVSIATVSRVLNNVNTVNESIRYVVLQAADELGYTLTNSRSKPQINPSVLVLTRTAYNTHSPDGAGVREFERRVWNAIHNVLDARGVAARLQNADGTADDAHHFANDVSINGVILLGGIIERSFAEELQKQRIPFVVAGSRLADVAVNCVMVDVAQGIREATRYLLAQGRKCIALVNGPVTTMTSAEKLDGLRVTLAEHGQLLDPKCVVTADFHPESGYLQTQALLEAVPHVDAILYADDSITLGGLRALRQSGRRVPNDVAIVGFGDYEIARYTEPLLSTVQFDMSLIGRIAAQRLCMLLDEPDDHAWLTRVPSRFIPREST
jgi:DNA-binding LacI/PurR family transcriptional regulator